MSELMDGIADVAGDHERVPLADIPAQAFLAPARINQFRKTDGTPLNFELFEGNTTEVHTPPLTLER